MENAKYKFLETTGCTAFDFSVNGRQFSDMSDQEYNEMLEYIFVEIRKGLKTNTILLQDVIGLFQPDDQKYDSEPCDQCGDTVSSTTWNI
jgi:hypothetical protein